MTRFKRRYQNKQNETTAMTLVRPSISRGFINVAISTLMTFVRGGIDVDRVSYKPFFAVFRMH